MRFIAIASVSCASLLIEPYDIAPVLKRCIRLSIDSTSSSGTVSDGLNSSNPRKVHRFVAWSFTSPEYALNAS
jgi:hypothetical protein